MKRIPHAIGKRTSASQNIRCSCALTRPCYLRITYKQKRKIKQHTKMPEYQHKSKNTYVSWINKYVLGHNRRTLLSISPLWTRRPNAIPRHRQHSSTNANRPIGDRWCFSLSKNRPITAKLQTQNWWWMNHWTIRRECMWQAPCPGKINGKMPRTDDCGKEIEARNVTSWPM